MSTTAARNVGTPHPARSTLSRTIAMLGLTAGLANGCSSDAPGLTGPPPQTGSIMVDLTPASMTVAPGSNSGAGVTVTRGAPFDGPVTLTASGVPAGVTVTFSPATVTVGMQSSLTVTVVAGTTPATAEIAIVGRSGTLMSPASQLTLRIQ